MTVVDKPTIDEQPCGCKTITYPVISSGTEKTGPEIAHYKPCLACALKNAGQMLMEAGKRMAEALKEEMADAERAAAAAKALADGFIGGTD